MANKGQLAILRKGHKAWNEWRENFTGVKVDLSGESLGGARLSGANLSKANLVGANFSAAELEGAILRESKLGGAKFAKANLRGVDLRGCDLAKADLAMADLDGADLAGADFSEAVLVEATLCGANLDGAVLTDVNLLGADLRRANLHAARLIGANLSGADLRAARLDDADLNRCILGYTRFDDVDLSQAKGLETARHVAPSTIGVDTLHLSKGKIPEIFLHGSGMPDNMIAWVRSSSGKLVDFSSCFISYSAQDQEFAERLNADLLAMGVRVWSAPGELKIGDKFRPRIDDAIRAGERELIVLSENTLHGEWLEKQVEAALEREKQQKRTVLIPVRLDDAIMHAKSDWAAELCRTHEIMDMTNWKVDAEYQKALTQLVQALTSPGAVIAGTQ